MGNIRNECIINGNKVYPIHLDAIELERIISYTINRFHLFFTENLKIRVRKDKGGKGLDFKIQSFFRGKNGRELKDRQYSFGINSNWEAVDFFDHWIPGKASLYLKNNNNVAAEEITDFKIPEIELILNERRKNEVISEVNKWFINDGWIDVYSHKRPKVIS